MRTKKQQQHIPRFNLSPLATASIYIRDMEGVQLAAKEHDLHRPHRDQHHLLILLKAGEIAFMVDFEHLQLKGPAIAMIFPDQVHHMVRSSQPEGYSLTFETAIIAPPLQKALKDPVALAARWTGDAVLLAQVFQLGDLLYQLKSASPKA
ncbi:MAG TPA: AraC family ligand binding domain-containing protein, partial [Chitinophaga sp.]